MKRSTTTLCFLSVLLLGSACGSEDSPSAAADPNGLGKNGLKLSGIGDSIMQGFDASPCGLPICFDQPEYSFAQGTAPEVNSLYLRFKEPGMQFVSASGAEMIGGGNNANAQANRICKQATRPNRIVIMLGANDICNATTVAALPTAAEFTLALDEALSSLVAEGCGLTPLSSIHVMSVPRVDLLHAAGVAKLGVDCSSIWSKFGICALATQSPSAADLQTIAATVEAYNQAILTTVTNMNANTDANRRLTFTTDYVGPTPNSSFGTYAFLPEDISDLDCFHPSILGQRKLGCLAWGSWQGDGEVAGCLE